VEAAETVTGADLDTLDRLVAKSLLVRPPLGPDEPTRLLMLETVRAYAAERFRARPDAGESARAPLRALPRRRRASRRRPGAVGPRRPAHAAALDAESDNLGAALAWAVDRRDPGGRCG
jgi:hypothetical protein